MAGDITIYETDAGILKLTDARVVIVRTEWNAAIVDKLEQGCLAALAVKGVLKTRSVAVPGAFEIPFGIRSYWEAWKSKDDPPHAFIALGCVLRGDTPHFDYVCRAVTDGILQLNLTLPVPVVFGILTVDSQRQADERTAVGAGTINKGEESAITALKMIALLRSFKIQLKEERRP
jgi:6,7-dimethyl-8-ribityllumazine synthase